MTAMTCDEIRDLAPAYVLGALERDEERAVTEHLRTCPDVHEEVSELGGVVPYLDETVPLVEPPASLRSRIMTAAAEDKAARRASAAEGAATGTARMAMLPARPASLRDSVPVIPIGPARQRRDLRTWALGLAAVLAIVALGGWSVVTQQELTNARSFQARLSAAIELAGQPGSQVAVLVSTGAGAGGPGGIAVMPASGAGTLVLTGLAPTTGGHVYEAWAILEGQPPAPVGSFTVGSDGVGYLDRMPNAAGTAVTVAITLEAQPDPPAPTTNPIAAGVAPPAGA